jgi:hypothetical protein
MGFSPKISTLWSGLMNNFERFMSKREKFQIDLQNAKIIDTSQLFDFLQSIFLKYLINKFVSGI